MAIEQYYNQAEAPPWIADAKKLALDIETSGLDPWRDRIAVVTIKDAAGHAAVVRCHSGVVPPWLQDKLREPGLEVVGHNLVGFDALCLNEAGVDLTKRTKIYDTMTGELVTLVNNRRSTRVNLAATVKRRTGDELNKEIDHGGWEAEQLDEAHLGYVLGDVDKLFELQQAQLDKVAGTPRAQAMEFEQALVPVTVGMTQRGMPFDEDAHGWLLGQARAKIAELNPKFEAKLGEINMRSHVQVKRAFAALGVNLPNTRKETLEELSNDLEDGDPMAQDLKDFITLRQNMHRSSVWDEEWVDTWLKHDGRMHFHFWQMGTDTIRYSSDKPNGQQIVRSWREMFGGVPGHKVVAIDYSQLEVRVGACIFADERLAEAVMSEDVHASVYSTAMRVPISEVVKDKEKRRLGKAMNFLLLFGGGIDGFHAYATRYGSKMTKDEAKETVYGYRNNFRGVDRARRSAGMQCDSGRPVFLTLPKGHQRMLVGEKLGPTVILNTCVQGTAATGIKCAMLEERRRELDKYLVMQVHDELVHLVPDEHVKWVAEEAQDIMKREMEKILPPVVPIATEVKIGTHWS